MNSHRSNQTRKPKGIAAARYFARCAARAIHSRWPAFGAHTWSEPYKNHPAICIVCHRSRAFLQGAE